MEKTLLALLGFILLSTTLAATAQFTYTTNRGAVTITGYTGLASRRPALRRGPGPPSPRSSPRTPGGTRSLPH